jgi:plastocyanin
MQCLPHRVRYLALAAVFAGVLPTTACATAAAPVAPGPTTSAMSMSAAPATASEQPVAANAVTIRNFAFTPQVITIRAGTTVTWTNVDQDAHTVTSQGGTGPLRSSALVTGDGYRYTFRSPGRYEYLCTIHPFMTATVVVTP